MEQVPKNTDEKLAEYLFRQLSNLERSIILINNEIAAIKKELVGMTHP